MKQIKFLMPLKLFSNFILIFTLMSGCAHQSHSIRLTNKTYSEDISNFNIESSFAFIQGDNKYYFLLKRTPGFLNHCMRFEGYKDEHLKYLLEDHHSAELRNIYLSDISIDNKINLILKEINKVSTDSITCKDIPKQSESSIIKKIDQVTGDVLGIVIYGSLVLIALPLVIPAVTGNYIAESSLQNKLKKIRLGESFENVTEIIDHDSNIQKKDEYLIQTFKYSYEFLSVDKKLVFVFKNNRLIAYVWGFTYSP